MFVPELDTRGRHQVERRWSTMCEKNPAAFDGRVLHVLGIHRNGHGGATIHAVDCAYRFYAVQNASLDLGIRPLGVKGLIIQNGSVLLGKRSQQVRWYPGRRELVPGGMVEPGDEPATALIRELAEETGLALASSPVPVAILYDPHPRTWEVIYYGLPAAAGIHASAEYDFVAWEPIDTAAEIPDLSSISRAMLALLFGAAAEPPATKQPPQ